MKKLRNRLLLLILIPTLVFFGGMIVYVSNAVSNIVTQNAETILQAHGETLALELQMEMERAQHSVETLSSTLRTGIQHNTVPSREAVNEMLTQLLDMNKSFNAVWTLWNPNSFDGLDEEFAGIPGQDANGRYLTLLSRTENGVDLGTLQLEGEFRSQILRAQQAARNYVSEPYEYVQDGETFLFTSIISPVIINGRVDGLVGIDIDLMKFDQLLSDVVFYDSGFAGLLSNNGIVISHENKSLIGTPYFDSEAMIEREDREELILAVKEGQQAYHQGHSNVLNAQAYRLFTPFQVGDHGLPWSAFISAPLKEVNRDVSVITNVIIQASVIIVLILGVLLVLITESVVRPIRAAVQHGAGMAAGDFSGTLRKRFLRRKDEIGDLARIFLAISDNMRNVIGKIQDSTRMVIESAQSMDAGAHQSSAAAREVASAIEQVAKSAEAQMQSAEESAKSMEDMSRGVQSVAQAASTVSEAAHEMNDRANSGQQIVRNAVQQMGRIQSETNSTQTVIERLQSGAAQIEGIVTLITGISEQTNLLALNAAIEAARAGEAGRGFAVVANQVRKLADDTMTSASEIQDLVGTIRSEALQASELMNGNTEEVKRGIVRIEEVGQAFEQMISAIQSVVGEVEELSAVAEQMSAGTEEIAATSTEIASSAETSFGHTQHVAAASEEQLASMEEMAQTSETLKSLADELNTLMQQFKI